MFDRVFVPSRSSRNLAAMAMLVVLSGCGTTRMTDTARTATEQLLVSDAVDRAIDEMNFKALAGKEIFFDPQYLRSAIDGGYIESSLRQHLLASGCILRANREDATYVVEARAGAVGTNRHDVLLGIPATTLPNMSGIAPGTPSVIPEIPFAKSTQQKGVAKLAVFAYNQHTGQPVWQSGTYPIVATSRDTWILGSGPFQRGSIYDGTRFAGSRILLPFQRDPPQEPVVRPAIPVTAEAVFYERPELARAIKPKPGTVAPYTGPKPPAGAPAAPTSVDTTMSGGQAAPTTGTANGTGTGGNGAQGLFFLGNEGKSFFGQPAIK
jgi:hypothetical protein